MTDPLLVADGVTKIYPGGRVGCLATEGIELFGLFVAQACERVNDAVAAIELPRLAGQELEPTVTGTEGYFLVTLPLAP